MTTIADRQDRPAPVVPRATAERLVVAALRSIWRPLNPGASFEAWLDCPDGVSAVADRLAVGGCMMDDQWVEFEPVAAGPESTDGGPGMRRLVTLASGGSVLLSVDGDLSEMSSVDRRLVLDLLGRIAAYAACGS